MIHRAKLRTRDYVDKDGTTVQVITSAVPIGADYLVDASCRIPPQPMYNEDLRRTFEGVEVVWCRGLHHGDNDAGGILPSQVLDIDEAPTEDV